MIKKRVLFGLGHPAHFHLYKNIISELVKNGTEVKVVISDKDILRELLINSKIPFESIAVSYPNESIISKANKLYKSTLKLIKVTKKFKPDLLIGCLSQLSWVGFVLHIPSVFNAEDDINYTYLQALITYPFINHIVSPTPTKVGIFSRKKIGYAGYHKLAYLHPNWFTVNTDLVYSVIPKNKFTIIRLVNLNAYHDINAKGISNKLLFKLISLLKDHGDVYITSENPLSDEFKSYKLDINPSDIHHFLAEASLFIGDSQSMSVEASLLGTPNIKFNDFAGKISVLEELEKKYKLTIGLNTRQENELLQGIKDLFSIPNIEFQERRKNLLNDKIDVTAFMAWFIENYPKSASIMREDPEYQLHFK
jgi:predicted glycosyltransferase